MKINFNNGWEFVTGKPDFIGAKIVRLPHNMVDLPYNYTDENAYQVVGYYRKQFHKQDAWDGKQIRLYIEAAAHYAKVYLNGELLGEHGNGYTAFTVDFTGKIQEDNELIIEVDARESLNIPPFGHVIDYLTYGGLYREVYLLVNEESYIEDVFVEMDVEAEVCKFHVQTTVHGDQFVEVKHILRDMDGNRVLSWNFEDAEFEDFHPWDIFDPYLYTLETQVVYLNEVVDSKITTIGIRKIEFKADGFYLNDQKVRIRGLDRHQSYPYVGYAMPASMQKMDAHVLHDELKLNAVRTSHYPQSQHFIDECDKLGLLVFTEIPGWQHIGDEEWKLQAIRNTEEMVVQYRNHPSIILWGVRINEAKDDDDVYLRTNRAARILDRTRPTSGVRYIKQSSLIEDVYAFNDFSHEGHTKGCLPKSEVTPDMDKGYIITEYNGHMYPTKAFDDEAHRTEHFLRHNRVLDEVRNNKDIAGSFGWCMADYNTHEDFGSGDRICYHGVLDMYRNPKLAAYAYKAFGEEPVLEVTSNMNIGDFPAGNLSEVYVASNADKIRLYKNDELIRVFGKDDRPFKHLKNSPFFIDDFIGDRLRKNEGFTKAKADDVKKVLIGAQKYGMDNLPIDVKLSAVKCLALHGMTFEDAVALYGKYIGGWGDDTTVWKFEAIKDGEVVKTLIKSPTYEVHFDVDVTSTQLVEGDTYDVAAIRLRAIDEYGNQLPYYQEPVFFEATGAIEVIGPKVSSFRGGATGTYVKTIMPGTGTLKIHFERGESKTIEFTVKGVE